MEAILQLGNRLHQMDVGRLPCGKRAVSNTTLLVQRCYYLLQWMEAIIIHYHPHVRVYGINVAIIGSL